MIIKSAASSGIGSLGMSPVPILVTTFSTSGKRFFMIWAAFCVISIDVCKLLPVNTLVSTAKSPSSNAGINSPPNKPKTTKEIKKRTITVDTRILGIFNALLK